MHYFDDMQNKYGFQDGDAVPAQAEMTREVYVRAINALAERNGSQIRVVQVNRSGVHNWCFIDFIRVGEEWTDENDVRPDDEMIAAIDKAMTLGLDDYVNTVVTIDPSFEDLLREMQ